MRSSQSFCRATYAIVACTLLAALAGCDLTLEDAAPRRPNPSGRPAAEIPIVNLPRALRGHLQLPAAGATAGFANVALQCVAAYILVDFLTGAYHLATDYGFNVAHQRQLFGIHHQTNAMDGFDWQPMLFAVPMLAVAAWLHSPFLTAGAFIGCVAQLPHYWAHAGSNSRIVRTLQATGLIISPKHHAGHHDGKFNRNFCILSGWNNWWMNGLLWMAGM